MELDKNLKYCLDTNILIYATDENSPFHSKARKLIDFIESQSSDNFYIADKTLFEYFAVLNNALKGKSLAIEFLDNIATRFENNIIRSKSNTIASVIGLLKYKQSKKSKPYIHDLVLAAICIDNQIDCLITQNVQDFQAIPGLRVFSL